MSSYSQYRITVNGTSGQITNQYPGQQWERIAEVSENHTMKATFERRLVSEYTPGIEKLFPGIVCDELYVSNWQVIAEIESI